MPRKTKSLNVFVPKPRNAMPGKHIATIEDLAADGRGVARVENKTVFLSSALPQEEVEFRYTQARKQYDEGELIRVLKPSPERVEPRCVYFQQCGGCHLQHLSYTAQLAYKQRWLQRLLKPLANDQTQWLPILHAGSYGYRHRARFAVSSRRGAITTGFRQFQSHHLVDIKQCVVLTEACNNALMQVRDALGKSRGKTTVREVEVLECGNGQVMLGLSLDGELGADEAARFRDLVSMNSLISAVYVLAAGQRTCLIKEGDGIGILQLLEGSISLSFQPGDFTQINSELNQKMIAAVIDRLQLMSGDRVIDYFCGLGNFTLPIAAKANTVADIFVTGVDVDNAMVERARLNARNNKVQRVDFATGDVFESITLDEGVSKVVLDPPRAGAETLCRTLVKTQLQTIVYVSCNPQTFARDTRILIDGGYTLKSVQPVDMFAQTRHIELIATFC